MSEPRIEIVLREGIVYRLTKIPDGQRRLRRGKKRSIPAPIIGRDPGDETRTA